MRLFERHFIKRSAAQEALRGAIRALAPAAKAEDPVAEALRLMCDEEALSLERIEAARETLADAAEDEADRDEADDRPPLD